MRLFLVLLPLLACGCLHDSQPRKQLSEAVHSMNDAARWGRLGTTVGLVGPAYMARFVEAHRGWGEAIQLADSEVVQVDFADDDHATAVVAYSWYNLRTMTLHSTVVQQHWVRGDDTFMLANEIVIKGDPDLFTPPAASAPASAPG